MSTSRVRSRVVGSMVGAALVAGVGVAIPVTAAASAPRYIDRTYDSLWDCWAGGPPTRDSSLYRDCRWSLSYSKWTKTWVTRGGGGRF